MVTVAEASIIIDTGPLVALLSVNDQFHKWAVEVCQDLPTPFLTSEAVLSETCFLLQRSGASSDLLFELLSRKSIRVAFNLDTEHAAIWTLMRKYASLPMSVADASLVRLAELHDSSPIFTLDRHFTVYRKHGRQKLALIFPPLAT